MTSCWKKSPLLADFKAVKTGNVWCTEKNLYQSTMELDELIRDFHTVIADGDPSTLKYLHKAVLKGEDFP